MAAMVVSTLAAIVYVYLHKFSLDLFYEYDKPLTSLTILGSPLFLLVYISARFRDILKEMAEESKKVLAITQEKQELLASQNTKLEE